MRRTAETVITKAIIETMRSTPTGERARRITQALDEAGYVIVPKPEPGMDADVLDLRTGVFLQDGVAAPFPEGTCRDWLSAMKALPLDPSTRPTGTAIDVIALMPDGTGVAMTNEEYGERARYCVPDSIVLQEGAEFTLPPGMELEPGTNAPPATSDQAPADDMDPHAKAVIDLISAHRLITSAERVLGHDAVDQILNWLPEPEPDAQAA